MTKRKPLHQRIYEDLSRAIGDGTYPPGSLLPSEQELIEHYGVSRAPVRQALGRLEADGKIVRRPGFGTVVQHPRTAALTAMSGFAEYYHTHSEQVASRLLSMTEIEAPSPVAEHLRLPDGATVVRLERMRLIDGEPIGYMINYLPGPLTSVDASDFFALSEIFQREWNVAEELVEEVLQAVVADERLANVLSVPVGAPLLRVVRLSWGRRRQPVAYSEYFVRSDRMSYRATLSRQQRVQ